MTQNEAEGKSKKMRLLILGVTGMLGNTLLRWFGNDDRFEVYGSLRSAGSKQALQQSAPHAHLIPGIDVEREDCLIGLFGVTRPDVVINCVGVIKQLASANNPLTTLPLNAMLPHRLNALCQVAGARLIHISTDCVFSGVRGNYHEADVPDAADLYGRSKQLGEVVNSPWAITLRTSIIGHELSSSYALLGWFLSQREGVKGFTRAIFSGVPTVELARIIDDYVLPHRGLHGLYHVSADPIDKYQLLTLIAKQYDHDIPIHPENDFSIDRSLDSSRFRGDTGYRPPDWMELIQRMREFG